MFERYQKGIKDVHKERIEQNIHALKLSHNVVSQNQGTYVFPQL